MKRSFQGMGYQYTTKSDWYIGTEVQFHHNKLNSNRLLPLEMQERGTLYACRVPGGSNETGYFVVPQSMQTSVEVITNNNVYKSEMPKLPQTSQSLYASRLELVA